MVGTRASVFGVHGEHNVSLTIKQRGLLPEFVKDCTEGKFNPEKLGMFPVSENLAKVIRLDVIERKKQEANELCSAIPDEQIPSFMFGHLYRRWLSRYLQSSDGRNFETRHAYPAHTGQIIEGTALMPYLGFGWAGPEKFGVWGVGLNHSLRLEIVDFAQGDRAFVVVYGRAFVHKNVPPIKLSGYINGQKSIETTCTSDQYQLEAVVSSPIVNIDLFTENPCSPRNAGISDDSREISVAITKICIYPRPKS